MSPYVSQQLTFRFLICALFIVLPALKAHTQNMATETIKFESLSPNLVVVDVNKSLDFYIKVLDFIFIASKPETDIFEWGMVSKDGVTLMFQTYKSLKKGLPSIKTPSGSFGTLFIKVTGIENYYDRVKKKVVMASELRLSDYGMLEFTIQDINGYYLTFAEKIK